MGNREFDFKTFFGAGDILAAIVIVAGILIAVFLDDLALKMIGVSVSLLGAIALFMMISQRLTDIVDTRAINKKKDKEYEVTTTYNSSGVRKTVENFDYSLSDDEFYRIKSHAGKHDNKDASQNDGILEAEKNIEINTKQTDKSDAIENDTTNTIIPKESDKIPEAYSGMRIVGKIKTTSAPKDILEEKEKIEIFTIKPKQTKFEPKKTIPLENIPEKTELIEDVKAELDKEVNTVQHQSIPDDNPNITQKKNNEMTSQKVDFPTHYFFEKDLLIGEEPKLEFDYFITRILLIIKSVTDTNTALLLLVDNKQENVTIEAFATDKESTINNSRKFHISHDIVSQIVKNAKPEILSEINPAAIKDLVPYYVDEVKIQSFIGIPVIWNDKVIGVLCADSELPDSYDSSTVSFMGQFTKLISGLVKSYTHKIDLLEAAKSLEIINKFQNIVLSGQFDLEQFYTLLAEDIAEIFKDYTIGIASYDYDKENWLIVAYKTKKSIQTNLELDLSSTLLGKCIVSGETIHSQGMELVNIIRSNKNEEKFTAGEFLAAPLRTQNGVYGAIFIENSPIEQLTDFDVSIIEILSNHVASTIERLNLINLYQTSCIMDRNTGLYNPNAFYTRINEEIERTSEGKDNTLILCLFRIDKYASVDPNKFSDRLELAVNNVINIGKGYIKKYEVFGRIDNETYGILFLNRDSSQVKLLAERFRNEVANSVLEFDGTKFSVTVSVGISVLSANNNVNTFVSNTISALTKSLELSNHVQIYY